MKRRAALGLGALLASVTVAACWSSVDANSGLEEPLRVRQNGAQLPVTFVPGALPGTTAPDAGTMDVDAGDPDAGDGGPAAPTGPLRVTTIESQNNVIYIGESGKKLDGHVMDGAVTLGVRFSDLGTGYWAFPVDLLDPQTPGERSWEAICDFSRTIPPGIHALDFVPFDASGVAGEIRELSVCIPSPQDGLHACAPKKDVPAAMIELTWDRNADVDLHVVTPDGKNVNPKNPSTSSTATDGGVTVDPTHDGTIDRDSNAGCVIDAQNREALTFPVYPTPGVYALYANLYDACGQPSVRFTMTVWVADGDGTDRHLVARYRQSGVLSAIDENSTDQTGLFVSDFLF